MSTTIKELVRLVDREDWNLSRSGWRQARKAYVFAQYVGNNKPAESVLNAVDIEHFLGSIERQHNLAPATVNLYAAAISKLCTYAMYNGLIRHKPKIKRRRGTVSRSEFFTREEQNEICSTVEHYGYPEISEFFVWLAETGMRLNEAIDIEWHNIDLKSRIIDIPSNITKTDKSRVIGMSRKALEAVKHQPKIYPGPWAWVQESKLRRIWIRLRKDVDWLSDKHVLHTFRHTCASRLIQSGASLYKVQKWLGHSSIVQTERYAKFATENMREMADLLDE